MHVRHAWLWRPAVLLALATPAAAHAQLGGLVKKAKTSATGQPGQGSNPNAKPSTAFGSELTEETLSAVLKGLAASQQSLDKREALAKQRQDLDSKKSQLEGQHTADADAYRKANDKVAACRENVFKQQDAAKQAMVQQKQAQLMKDPAAQAQMQKDAMAMQQQMQQMQAKGDTAGMRQVQIDFMNKQLGANVNPKADTAAADAKCGAAAPKPAWMVEADKLGAQSDDVGKQIRELETNAASVGATTSGLPAAQYEQGRERLLNWYRGGPNHNNVQNFSAQESELFNKHKADIEKVSSAL